MGTLAEPFHEFRCCCKEHYRCLSIESYLLHYVGEDVFDLSESLGIESDTPFEETKRLLTAYFAPQRNVEYGVFVSRQAAQHTDETLTIM